MELVKGGVRGILIDREQAESIVKDLMNSLDHSLCESVILMISDDEAVDKAMAAFTAGYQPRDVELPPLPAPEFLYMGVVYTLAFGKTPEEVIQGIQEEVTDNGHEER